MNNRIKEIANEAFTSINDMASEGIADRHTFNMHWFQLYNQKFAELLIQDCANIANAGLDPSESYLPGEDILNHFGVE